MLEAEALLTASALLLTPALLACSGSDSSSGGSGGSSASGGSAGAPTGGSGGAAGVPGAGAAGAAGAHTDEQRFAVIGDYGDDALTQLGLAGEDGVADLVNGWNVDFVITLGDNNYPNGAAATIDNNVGKYYAGFLGGYHGAFGPGSDTNRFWPTPGNHDWRDPGLAAYLDYFTLPGNERYYDVEIGRVHLFALDSDGDEPDGVDEGSTQAQWFQKAIAGSAACFRVVYFHHPPYSSGDHGSNETMRWPFEAWGADVVLAGHDHTYERLQVGGIPYFVNGLGGAFRYPKGTGVPESQLFYNEDWGAQLVTVTPDHMTLEFFDTAGTLIDSYTISRSCG